MTATVPVATVRHMLRAVVYLAGLTRSQAITTRNDSTICS